MARLTEVRTVKLIHLCESLGWKRTRTKGDHLALTKANHPRPIIIQLKKTVPIFIINQIIKEHLKLNRDEYIRLMRNL